MGLRGDIVKFGGVLLSILFLQTQTKAGSSEREVFRTEIVPTQQIRVIEHGSQSLSERIAMIQRAQKSVQIEATYWDPDQSGCLILGALVKKTQAMRKNGSSFQVKILLDYDPMGPHIDEFYANEVKQQGIEFKYYNPSEMLNLSKSLHRNHKKIFLIDAETGRGEFIIGGRNHTDAYFDLSAKNNFLDRDVWGRGETAAKLGRIFNADWNSNIVAGPGPLPPIAAPPSVDDSLSQRSRKMAMRSDWEQKQKNAVRCMRPEFYNQNLQNLVDRKAAVWKANSSLQSVANVLLISDQPNWNQSLSPIGSELMNYVKQARSSVLMENPYFIPMDENLQTLKNLIKSRKQFSLLGNSRRATPEFINNSMALYRAKEISNMGGEVLLLLGQSDSEKIPGIAYYRDVRWGTHAKTMIVDAKTTYIGSGNFDSRSLNRINAEIGLIVPNNPQFAKYVFSLIVNRAKGAYIYDRNAPDQEQPRSLSNLLAYPFIGIAKLFEHQM